MGNDPHDGVKSFVVSCSYSAAKFGLDCWIDSDSGGAGGIAAVFTRKTEDGDTVDTVFAVVLRARVQLKLAVSA